MSTQEVLLEGAIDPRVKHYWLTQATIVCVLTGILIPLLPIVLVAGSVLVDRWLAKLRCALTERHLFIRKGILNRVESTIPLGRITDLQMYQGPLMRCFGLQGFRVETAGQSSGSTGYLVNLVGLRDAEDFRAAVLDQRDRVEQGGSGALRAGEANRPEGVALDDLAREIRDGILRIEALLARRDGGPN